MEMDCPNFNICLKDMEITNLSEPILKFMHFKAKCKMDRKRDQLAWEEYCCNNSMTNPVPSTVGIKKLDKSMDILKPFIEKKSVSIQTLGIENKIVQVKFPKKQGKVCMKNVGTNIQPSIPIKKQVLKKDKCKDKLKASPTMNKLENAVLDELIDDVRREIEEISWKEKLQEMKVKEKKLKAVRIQLKKLQELSESERLTCSMSNSTPESVKSDKPKDWVRKPFILPIHQEKWKQISQYNKVPLYNTMLKMPDFSTSLFEEISDSLLQEILSSVTQEVVEIVDYVADVSYQEELELF